MTPADRLRATADDSDAHADHVATAPRGPGVTEERQAALAAHFRGRARLYRRCAESAARIDAIDPAVLEALS